MHCKLTIACLIVRCKLVSFKAITVCTIVIEFAQLLTSKLVGRQAKVVAVADARGLIFSLATVILVIAYTAHWDAVLAIIVAVKLAIQVTYFRFLIAVFFIRAIRAVNIGITFAGQRNAL